MRSIFTNPPPTLDPKPEYRPESWWRMARELGFYQGNPDYYIDKYATPSEYNEAVALIEERAMDRYTPRCTKCHRAY